MTETSSKPADVCSEPLVLVVEDDREQREAVCALLELEGFGHFQVANGREALAYLRDSQAPCLVLLDLEMPVMNGWEFRASQLADERLSRIPVVVVTASEAVVKEHFPGLDGFLAKPLRSGKLVEVLERLCVRRHAATKSPALAV